MAVADTDVRRVCPVLNDIWSLTVGYRLRYLAGDGRVSGTFAHDRVKWDWKVKQDLIHAAEVGVTYWF